MTVETPSTQEEGRPAGASSHADDNWDGIQWYRTQRNVRRLQARIVKATQEKRWGVGTMNWIFTGEVEDEERHKKLVHLRRAFDVKIQRHTSIQGEANPFDPDWEVYFEKRLGVKMAQNLAGRRQLRHLWEEQNGRCPMRQRKP